MPSLPPWCRTRSFESPVPIWHPAELTAEAAAMPADSSRVSRSMAMLPRASSTPPAPPALPRAPSSRTTTSPPTPSICWPAGRSPSADRFLLALPLFHVHALGNGLHCWLISRLPHAPAGALRARQAPRPRSSIFAPRCSSACPRFTSACSIFRPEHAREIGALHAPLRIRLGAARRAGAGRVPRALRPHHPGALRHERDPHEHQQSVRRRAPPGKRRPAAARRFGAPGGGRDPARRAPTSSPGYWRRLLAQDEPRAPPSSTAGSAPATWPSARPTATTRCAAAGAT